MMSEVRRYRALLIGVGQYELLPRLHGPAVDVDQMAEVLTDTKLGLFEPDDVNCLVDITAATARREIASFFASGCDDELLLFYFSGHGVAGFSSDEASLCGIDTDGDAPDGTGVAFSLIRDIVDRSRAGARVVIFDCCYSFRLKSVDTSPGLPELGRGTFFLRSTRPGEYLTPDAVAPGEPSQFTAALVRGLRSDLGGTATGPLIQLWDLAAFLKRSISKPEPSFGAPNFDGRPVVISRTSAFRPVTKLLSPSPVGSPLPSPTIDSAGDEPPALSGNVSVVWTRLRPRRGLRYFERNLCPIDVHAANLVRVDLRSMRLERAEEQRQSPGHTLPRGLDQYRGALAMVQLPPNFNVSDGPYQAVKASSVQRDTCHDCGGEARIKNRCTNCAGSGRVHDIEIVRCSCPVGRGTSSTFTLDPLTGQMREVLCPDCRGSGQHTKSRTLPCQRCNETGSANCVACGGTGRVISYSLATITVHALPPITDVSCRIIDGAPLTTTSQGRVKLGALDAGPAPNTQRVESLSAAESRGGLVNQTQRDLIRRRPSRDERITYEVNLIPLQVATYSAEVVDRVTRRSTAEVRHALVVGQNGAIRKIEAAKDRMADFRAGALATVLLLVLFTTTLLIAGNRGSGGSARAFTGDAQTKRSTPVAPSTSSRTSAAPKPVPTVVPGVTVSPPQRGLTAASAWLSSQPQLAERVRTLDCSVGGWFAQLSSDNYDSARVGEIIATIRSFASAIIIDTALSCDGLREPNDRIIVGLGPFPTHEQSIQACAATGRKVPDDCFANSVADSHRQLSVGDDCPSTSTDVNSVRPPAGSTVIFTADAPLSRVILCRLGQQEDERLFYFGFGYVTGRSVILSAVRRETTVVAVSNDGVEFVVTEADLTIGRQGSTIEVGHFERVDGALR